MSLHSSITAALQKPYILEKAFTEFTLSAETESEKLDLLLCIAIYETVCTELARRQIRTLRRSDSNSMDAQIQTTSLR